MLLQTVYVLLQGWIPRSGLQYGADLVLYEQHPSLVHSTVCVLIVPMKGERQSGCNSSNTAATAAQDGHDGHLASHSVEGINRLCTRVNDLALLNTAVLIGRLFVTVAIHRC